MILLGEDNATWADAKRELQDVNFKAKIRDLDVERIPTKAYKKVIKEYLTNPTHETAFSLLDARPWKTNTLVSISSNNFSILTILTSHSRWALSNGSPTRRC